tara:strand:+ start:26491 stop:29850 length:3360 start_codon:yes stop_codon:yes gene_type:complete
MPRPTFYPKKLFSLSGSNLNFVDRVFFGEEVVEEISFLGTTGISGVVPAAAYTNLISFEGGAEVLNITTGQVVLDSSSQVVVSGLLPEDVSGEAGEFLTLTGENFHQITDIKFGSATGFFNTVSDSEIHVKVPENAEYHGVSVVSSLRTGLNGSTSESSGITVNEFVPIPEVTGLSSGQLVSGETLTIEGLSLSGVVGVSINNIALTGYWGNSALDGPSSTGIQVEVPTGNLTGSPVLTLKSGIKYSAPASISFQPLALVTGVKNNVEVGQIMDISGENFTDDILYSGSDTYLPDPTADYKYLVSIGGQTGNAKLVNDRVLKVKVPTGMNIHVSGNLGEGNTLGNDYFISEQEVSVFTKSYPNTYPSEIKFTPGIGAPSITGVSPISGIKGDIVTLMGTNLYAITGTDFGNVGTDSSVTPTQVVAGEIVQFEVPEIAGSETPATGYDYTVSISGKFGSDTAQFRYIGMPEIDVIHPCSGFLPGSTGCIYGSRLHSGTSLTLHNNNVAPVNFRGDIEVSGYRGNNTQVVFYYPNSFNNEDKYKIRARNRRGVDLFTGVLGVKAAPIFSGFSPASGEFGDTITLSGYFETVKPSGLKVGSYIVDDFNQSSTTGIEMVIPNNIVSDYINVETSGGAIDSTGVLGVSAPKPSISGFYLGNGNINPPFNEDQVFKGGDIISITGERINLVTGVLFSGDGGTISVNQFNLKNPYEASFTVPRGINSGSGIFETRDFKNRKSVTPFSINVTDITGFSNYAGMGQTVTVSGQNLTGLNVNFPYPTGGYITAQNLTNSVTSLGEHSITVDLPTGITEGNIQVSGRGNTNASIFYKSGYNPLAMVTGVTGFNSSNTVASGTSVAVSGLNSYSTNYNFTSGQFAVGITGTGNKNNTAEVYFYPISGNTTGYGAVDSHNLFYNKFSFQLDSGFIGTGRLFVLNPWDSKNFNTENIRTFTNDFLGSTSEEFLATQANFFPDNYIIQGTRVNATGFGPTRGVTGSSVEVTGEGFTAVSGVFFQIPNGPYLESSFTINSDNKITATVPTEGIEARGSANLILSGGSNDSPGKFEVILDASVVEFNITDEGDYLQSSTRVGNFTQRETVGGVVYLVTRTRFPDGTTAVVSSAPEL